jgi:hypothetical protein
MCAWRWPCLSQLADGNSHVRRMSRCWLMQRPVLLPLLLPLLVVVLAALLLVALGAAGSGASSSNTRRCSVGREPPAAPRGGGVSIGSARHSTARALSTPGATQQQQHNTNTQPPRPGRTDGRTHTHTHAHLPCKRVRARTAARPVCARATHARTHAGHMRPGHTRRCSPL